jgi:two-component system sensor histidine kinase UhpB
MSGSRSATSASPRAARGRQARAPARQRYLRVPYRRLFWRIFALNAAVLALACALAVVVFSPGTISSRVALEELAIFLGALCLMVVANLLLTRRITAPVEELVELMRRVDPLHPGARVAVRGGPSEAAELALAFNEMLDRLEDERNDSTRRALNAQESERLRVAQELHDEVGQNLTAALLQLSRVRRIAPAELSGELEEATETIRENLDDLRCIAQRLRPPALDELGLASALGHLAEQLATQTGLAIERRLAHDLPVLGHDEELVVYRVAQEALTNVVRHAGASRAELTLERTFDSLVLRVADDGRGPPGASARTGGIRGMHERAALIDAELRIGQREPRGTEVVLRVPLGADRR